MKRILVTGAGGSPAIGFQRSLKAAPEAFHLIGVDTNPYTLQRAEVDQRFLVPRPSHPGHLAVLNGIIGERRIPHRVPASGVWPGGLPAIESGSAAFARAFPQPRGFEIGLNSFSQGDECVIGRASPPN